MNESSNENIHMTIVNAPTVAKGSVSSYGPYVTSASFLLTGFGVFV